MDKTAENDVRARPWLRRVVAGSAALLLMVCLPALGEPKSAAGDSSQRLRVQGELTSYARLMRMTWDRTLALERH